MRAVQQTGFGGTAVLEPATVPDPAAGPEDVVVRVEACGLNRLDLLQRTGAVRLPGFSLPHVGGMDVAGVVADAGSRSTVPVGARVVVDPTVPCGRCALCRQGRGGHCAGVRVVGGNVDGGLAEYVAVPASAVHRLPGDADLVQAACLPSPWATAWHAVVAVGRLRAGETLLVPAAAGSIGLAAVQIGRLVGARVVASASTSAKAAALTAVGVDHVAVGDAALADLVADVTDGAGVQVVLEHVGPATWGASMAALAVGGRLVFLGNSSGDAVTFSLASAFHRGLELLGAGAYTAADMAAALRAFWTGGGVALVAAEHPLAETAAAHDQLADRSTVGRVLVRP
ncbi:MAG: alcohol dehydrogenase catalytic domain-containing protein [Actinobacteria bacterium]|uniref:Unannotated protein n=1 Tax=freshwater metagenome TaxID=449393 RepID=A0A6J7G0Z6_9ZZZZ|nr:alcohol dehydrogenase catalytic domain-containing protein [Actinomycetota bacterium]